MTLYFGISGLFFLLLLMGLRPDSIEAVESWPGLPAEKKARTNQYIVSFFSLILFILLWGLTAFRSKAIGNDTANYLMYFALFSKGLDVSSYVELGYQVLNYIISKFTQDPHHFIIIMATVMYGGIGLYLYRFCKNPAIALCLFYSLFFSVYTSILRQGMAMVIALYGYQLLKDGKKIPAAILFAVASFFHNTAVLCFLLFLNFNILKKWWFVLGLTVLCAVISLTGVMKMVVNAILPKYTHYFEGQYASSGWLAISFFLFVYVVFYILICKSLDDNSKTDNVIAANFSLLLMITAFGYAVNLFERAGEYFLLIGISELPNVLYRGKVKNFRIWLFAIGTIYLIFFVLVLIYRPGWNHLYPYEFWH